MSNIKNMKLLMIGAGNMGLTYAEGMSQSPLLNNQLIRIHDKSPEIKEKIEKDDRFIFIDDLNQFLPEADIVFLAVKPYHKEAVFEEINMHVNPEQLFVSLMAGVNIKTLSEGLNAQKIVRTMPNLPAQVGKGVTSFTISQNVSKLEAKLVKALLDTTGVSVKVANEKFIDASTGISGSGPAYVFFFMESMMKAAQDMGFSDKVSKVLVSQTFEGAVELFNQNNLSPQKWMDKVASKGGTTRAALDSMEDNNLRQMIHDAAYAAFDRAVELGNE
ncbi:MAG: pyrroline-5-carboxylate reductase [Weeksellaceae bacterium]